MRLGREQLRAAALGSGPVRVVAGAGTGKTAVIAERFRRLVASGVAPESILVMTFTERAAAQMRQRIEGLIDRPAPAVGTFHSLALSWLREDGRTIGVPAGFAILTGAERWIFTRELMWGLADVALTGDERPDDLVGPLLQMLERLKQELVKVATEIVDARAKAVSELEPVAARCHRQIAVGERLEIRYLGPPENLAQAVQNSLAEDLRRGTTSIGPHRDDLLVLLDGQEARSFASQGQQRTAVVSLKLAEAALIEARTGERPVLLLDDVLSELDGGRRAALLNEVGGGGQVIITSVEAGPFPPELIARAMVWTVEEGRIQACG